MKQKYGSLRLNLLDEASWAVVRLDTGAIALDPNGRLIMRLPKTEADRIAAELSAAANDPDDTRKR